MNFSACALALKLERLENVVIDYKTDLLSFGGSFVLVHRGKTSELSRAPSHAFLNLRHNSEHVDHVISGTGRPQENSIFRSLKTHSKITFYPNRKFFPPRLIARNVGSDGKIKILTIWAL